MKCTVAQTEIKARLPEVGEPWCHGSDGPVLVRIRDEDGRAALASKYKGDYFFSVDLTDGRIMCAPLDITDIIILKPKGGKLAFVQA